MHKPSAIIAFFDLDKTLIDVNSATLWVKSELREGRISWWMATRAFFWTIMYSLGWTRMERLLLEGIAWLHGQKVGPLVERTHNFYLEHVRIRYRPGAMKALQAHKDAGHVIALCTSSSSILSHFVAQELAIPYILANGLATAENHFTGKPDPEVLCYGNGKLVHAQALAARLDVSLDDCVFYTDSVADLSLLEKVGTPVVVHPDRRLRRIAVQRSWLVEDWGENQGPLVEHRFAQTTPDKSAVTSLVVERSWPGIADS
ncbi:MAG: haloacid dehalogenase-like hydrolase [Deltaproteobacteria bacterium]|nr:haloacid dehalogenase-like hydrolase [Deltaproteobacteria bacterium]